MISKGIVQKIEKNEITVKFYKDSACAHCSSCSPDKKFGNIIKISSPLSTKYKVEDEITIEIEDSVILKLSLITYILPAIFMILGYVVADFFGASEGISILSCFLALVLSFLGLYFYDKKRVKDFGSDITIID